MFLSQTVHNSGVFLKPQAFRPQSRSLWMELTNCGVMTVHFKAQSVLAPSKATFPGVIEPQMAQQLHFWQCNQF